MEQSQRELAAGFSIGARAAALGHTGEIEHVGKRFRIVCECGWKTPANVKRKTAFELVTAHVLEVLRQSGEINDTRSEIPGSVSGRA
jgi:hypothetical protein